jgi:hypothetical protein
VIDSRLSGRNTKTSGELEPTTEEAVSEFVDDDSGWCERPLRTSSFENLSFVHVQTYERQAGKHARYERISSRCQTAARFRRNGRDDTEIYVWGAMIFAFDIDVRIARLCLHAGRLQAGA